jgi:hypothetical protein
MIDYASSELLQKNFNKCKSFSSEVLFFELACIVYSPSSPNYSHAQLVMDKDDQLFPNKRHITQITKDECTVPTLDDVRATMAAGNVATHST